MRSKIILGLLITILAGCGKKQQVDQLRTESANSNPHYSSWSHYLGDPERTHFSLLSEINTENVQQLKPVWRYKSGGLGEDRNTQIQTNPLIVGNILYGVNAANSLFAIEAATGNELWTYSPATADATGLGLSRGLMYWESENGTDGRIFYTSGYSLYALDALTGEPITNFGAEGSVDLRENLGRDPKKIPIVVTTPGVIFKDLYILGCRTSESPGAAPGHIRAYNVITGEMEWIFHTIPQPGEFGYDTWPEEAYKSTGGANNWAGMALDEGKGHCLPANRICRFRLVRRRPDWR